jgi:hypothetical protein
MLRNFMLIDKVDISLADLASGFGFHDVFCAERRRGRSVPKDAVQKVHVALSSSFRKRLRNGSADNWPTADKSHVRSVGETYSVLWTFQHRNEAGGLFKQALLPGYLFGEPPLSQDSGRSFGADNEHAANSVE